MKKKLICMVLVVVLALGLVACQSDVSETQTPSADTSTSTEPTASADTSATVEPTEVSFPKIDINVSDAGSETSFYGEELIKFKDYVENATNGQVTVNLFMNGSLFSQSEQLPACMKGNVEMTHALASKFTDYFPTLSMLDSPYLFKSLEHATAFYSSDTWNDMVDEIAEKTGVRFLGGFVYGTRAINLREDKKVTSRADLKNVKLRMIDTAAWQFMGESLGGNPIPLAYSDLYLALQNGTVDGQDNPINALKTESFYEVTKSITLTRHVYAYEWIVFNEELWQSLSPELQQIIQEGVNSAAAGAEEKSMNAETDLIPWCEEKGISVYELTDEELASYQQEVVDYYFANGADLTSNWDMDLYQEIQDLA